MRLFAKHKKHNGQEFIEKNLIAQSRWWDPLWYVQTYNHDFNRYEALDYWYKTGWRKGESPSQYLNLQYFRSNINPVLAYMSKGPERAFFPDNKNNFKTPEDSQRIREYLAYKQTRQSKSVVYTCISNDYDDIHELEAYGYINPEWDYVCFTDNAEHIAQKQIGIWEIRSLQFSELDATRNNRWHKIHPHLLFSQYEESIYIDSNINILTDFLFRQIAIKNKDFILPRHFKNQCIYQEFQDCLAGSLDKAELINSQLAFIKADGMPKNYGFMENNILYRRHHTPKVIKIMNEWWNMVVNYAKRDQLSLAYLFWKNNLCIADVIFENSRLLIDDFYVFGHKKGRS